MLPSHPNSHPTTSTGMPLKATIQTALRRISVCTKKDSRSSLLEPPFLALPNSPRLDCALYVIDDLMNLNLSMPYEADEDKTYYENETFDFYTSDPEEMLRRSSTKRKRSGAAKPFVTSTPYSFDNPSTAEMDYSPPVKRAPILRRIPLKIDVPQDHPPPVPIKEDAEEKSCYEEPISHQKQDTSMDISTTRL